MSLLLKQLDELTSGIRGSSGSTKVISTHYFFQNIGVSLLPSQFIKIKRSEKEESGVKRTENKAAPCLAISTIWIVALSPADTVVLVGRGTSGRHTVPGYGFAEGPRIWKGETIGLLMLGGPPSGPSVPKPRLTYMKAV